MNLDLFEGEGVVAERNEPQAGIRAALAASPAKPGHAQSPSQSCPPDYKLPGDPFADAHIIPVSGGADSSYLAVLLTQRFPEVPFLYVFTDTGAEEPEIYETLDRLEGYIGRPIIRLRPDKDLLELLAHYNGFLMSPKDRWCTRETKLQPFHAWLASIKQGRKFMYVGVRADEQARVAFVLDGVDTQMPFIDLGIDRSQVFKGLSETIGIPAFYRRRVRSGCFLCPYQRRSEVVGLLQEKPIEFKRSMAYEKVDRSDLDRHTVAPSLSAETGRTWNWLPLPEPDDGEISGRLRRTARDDLFGNAGVFIAAEFFYDSFCGINPFVWHQRLVSYSPTLDGIKRQIRHRFTHLLQTSEVFDMTPDEVRGGNVKFAIYYIEAPASVFDPRGPLAPGFTWAQGTSYAQIMHIMSWAERVLRSHALARDAQRVDEVHPLSFEYESAASSVTCLQQVHQPIGAVVQSAWHQPEEMTLDEELDVRFVTCAACSL